MFSFLRYIKSIFPRRLDPIWLLLGSIYRYFIKKLNINFYVNQKISTYGPFKLHCFFAFSNFRSWGSEKKSIFPLMMDKSKNKKCIVDIGAHIGLMTLPLSLKVKKDAKIILFEPSDINRKFLKLHMLKNKIRNVDIIDKIVGNKVTKDVLFYESNEPTGMNSIIKFEKKVLFKKKLKEQVSLDSYFEKKKYKPDLIKIDAEGSELYILKGSIKTILKHKPDIFLSILKKHFKLLGIQIGEFLSFLKKINYNIKDSSGIFSNNLDSKEYYLYSK